MSLIGRIFKRKPDSSVSAVQPQEVSESYMPTEKPDYLHVTEAVKIDLWQAIVQTESIPFESAEFIHETALRSAVNGDLYTLGEALNSLGMQKQLSVEHCRWLATRGKSLITRDRQLDLGITEAVWVYSGAPCMSKPGDEAYKVQDEAHRLANGQKFKIAEGLTLNGKNTWPGYDPNCKCSSKPVLPL